MHTIHIGISRLHTQYTYTPLYNLHMFRAHPNGMNAWLFRTVYVCNIYLFFSLKYLLGKCYVMPQAQQHVNTERIDDEVSTKTHTCQ